ncbi:hypothetical protein Csa_015802, partial [Cucumis sativus]
MQNTAAPSPIAQNPQFPTKENMTSAPAPAPAATSSDNASGHPIHHSHSINSNNHCCKSDGNSDAGNFSDHRSWPDKVHINEAASVNPPVALPLHNRMLMRPPMPSLRPPPPPQYGDHMGFRGSHGFWPGMSEPWSSPSHPPPPHSYYRWPEPVPYYLQEQQPPVGNTPNHYVFNDENTEG